MQRLPHDRENEIFEAWRDIRSAERRAVAWQVLRIPLLTALIFLVLTQTFHRPQFPSQVAIAAVSLVAAVAITRLGMKGR